MGEEPWMLWEPQQKVRKYKKVPNRSHRDEEYNYWNAIQDNYIGKSTT